MSTASSFHLMLIYATAIKIETHLEKLIESINNYVSDNSVENKQTLQSILQIVSINLMTNGNMDEALKMAKNLEQFEKREEFFKTNNN